LQGSVLVAGAGHSVASAEDCCAACWNYGGKPGRGMNSSSGARQPQSLPVCCMHHACGVLHVPALQCQRALAALLHACDSK
jgi:hypothetical protein